MQKQIIIYLIIFLVTLSGAEVCAQVSIKEDGSPIDSSAQLELQSTDKGYLLPRMTSENRIAISDPEKGLLIFQTDGETGFQYNVNTSGVGQWESILKSRDVNIIEPRTPIDFAVTITEPGSYYLRDTLYEDSADGIRIDADNVTIDLNGFAIIGANQSNQHGIRTVGNHNNITIKNGTITGFGGYGILGFNISRSTFTNLLIENNESVGMSVGNHCLVINCTATQNGGDGLMAGVGSIIRDCTAAHNEGDGIQCSTGGTIYNCLSTSNDNDGISAASASRVENCTVNNNTTFGIDMATSGMCFNNLAYRNGAHGLDISSNCIVMHNVSNENGTCITNGTCSSGEGNGSNVSQGAGIRTFANSVIVDNQCSGNYFGIVVSSTDTAVKGNNVQNNSHAGIMFTSSSSLFIGNTAHGNGFAQSPSVTNTDSYPIGDIAFTSSALLSGSYGPIIDVISAGDISTIANSDHPFANIVY